MKEATILKKVIEQAVRGGWENKEGIKVIQIKNSVFLIKSYLPPNTFFDINEIIFDHDFAKAYWGSGYKWFPSYKYAKNKKKFEKMIREAGLLKDWQYHIQQLAISKNRLKYLKRFLKK